MALLSREGAGRQDVVVMGEREETHYTPDGTPYWPGIEGPISICKQLHAAHVCGRMRFAMPPKDRGKDLREWLTTADAPATELMAVIKGAADVDEAYLDAAKRRIAAKKLAERRPTDT